MRSSLHCKKTKSTKNTVVGLSIQIRVVSGRVMPRELEDIKLKEKNIKLEADKNKIFVIHENPSEDDETIIKNSTNELPLQQN